MAKRPIDVREEDTNVITPPRTVATIVEMLAHWLIQRNKAVKEGEDSLDVTRQLRDCRVTKTEK